MSTNAILLIQNNEVIGHSTDTVFGLIAKVDKENIEKINSIKGRRIDQPLQILFSNMEEVLNVIEPNDYVIDYIKSNLNNSTSFIVKVKEVFANKYLNNSFNKTIMFRIPEGEIQNLLKETKMLFATSANSTGEQPVLNKEQFDSMFPNIKSFGNEALGKASTIIDLTTNKPIVKRK